MPGRASRCTSACSLSSPWKATRSRISIGEQRKSVPTSSRGGSAGSDIPPSQEPVEVGEEEIHRHQREEDGAQAGETGHGRLPTLPPAQPPQQESRGVEYPGGERHQDLGIAQPGIVVELLRVESADRKSTRL